MKYCYKKNMILFGSSSANKFIFTQISPFFLLNIYIYVFVDYSQMRIFFIYSLQYYTQMRS